MGSPPQRSHFGEFVQRFAWACLLRPTGARMLNEEDGASSSSSLSNEEIGSKSKKKSGSNVKSKSSSFKDTKDDPDDSFHEAESEYFSREDCDKAASPSDLRLQALEGFVSEVFTTVSALKSAYIQLQAAHSPFDPEKLRQADKAVIVELRRLSEMKHSFKDNKGALMASSKNTSSNNDHPEELRRKIQELQAAANSKQRSIESYDARLRACEKEIEAQNSQIASLNETLRLSNVKKDKLERKLRKCEQHHHRMNAATAAAVVANNGIHQEPTVELFEKAVQGAREAELGFVKTLVSLMRGAQWDLEAAAESIEPGISYARPAHRRFAFESYACHRIFCGFENENFYINGSLSSILDPAKHRAECFAQFRDMGAVDAGDLLGITPECMFGKFCHRKYLQIVHERMEESFFGGFGEHRDVVLAGCHPRTRFYQGFLRFAKAVWLVHLLAFSFEPTATIFQVRRGTEFDPAYMESAARNVRMNDDDEGVRPRVGFTVMPGFRVDKWVVKCQVYLDSMVASETD